MTNLVQPIPVPDLATVRHAHLMAVGGAGMSPIAHLMRARGIEVDGCDWAESDVVEGLRADGIPVAIGHDPSHLAGVDTVVASSAIRETNPELVAAQAAGLPVWHRSVALAGLMAGHLGVAITGTHGKSTTSAMVATSLAGIDPSYVVGAVINQTGAAYRSGRPGGVFVIEADESDGSFLQYQPQVVTVTNIEADHLDRWGTPEAYADGFATLASGPSVRCVVLSADDPGTLAVAENRQGPVLLFGESQAADVRLSDIRLKGLGATATITWPGGTGQIELQVPGHHNLLDAAAAVATAVALRDLGVDVDIDGVVANLAHFRGTGRRFQIVGQTRGITVVDDYAHHPTEIAATLTAARAAIGPKKRLVACFQPHLYTRTRDFADAFGEALSLADLVLVTDVYAAREDPIPGVTGQLVADAAIANGAITKYVASLPEAVSALVDLVGGPALKRGDLIVTLGAGDVTKVGPAMLAALEGGGHD
ncbi:MAG: UDP-N-acetylmuramate--L-alanine ligase [Propionibacteriaceae bacterium]|nr:UDP-N-acetylmuramate--L-alanine ligase [Propionibacteriaceae bacterium]